MSNQDVKEFINKRGVAGKAALWQQKVDHPQPHRKKPGLMKDASSAGAAGPNVEWDGTCYRQKLSGGHDEDYGRPPPGSKTELRGRKAGMLISGEVVEVCYNILRIGYRCPDGTYIVNFGTLFEMYTKISNKLVGMLLRARRQGLVQFEGEMLFQGRDNHVIIKLVKVPKDLEECYTQMDGPIPDHMKMDH